MFLTVFPTIVDPFEPSVSFFHTFFQCFLPLKLFAVGFFESVKKKLYSCWMILGLVWGHFLVMSPVKRDLTTHKLGGAKTHHDKLIIYGIRFTFSSKNVGQFRFL